MLVFLVACAAAINPPTTGKFFYSDFHLDMTIGLHSMTLATQDASQVFYCMVSTNEYITGLYSDQCSTCKDDEIHAYTQTSTTQVIGGTLTQAAKMYFNNALYPVTFSGTTVKDNFKIFFSREQRSLSYEMEFASVN